MTAAAVWRGVFIERLKATGNITLAASGAGVARQHAYWTRNRSKAFRCSWEEALEQAVDLLEGEARRRATGINRDVWYAGEVVGTERAYSDTLLIFLLKAHRPAKFRDNVKVEHSAGANPATRALVGGHVGTPPSGAEGRTESPAKATWPQRDIRGDTLAAGARRVLSRLGLESVTEVLRRVLVPPAPAAA